MMLTHYGNKKLQLYTLSSLLLNTYEARSQPFRLRSAKSYRGHIQTARYLYDGLGIYLVYLITKLLE